MGKIHMGPPPPEFNRQKCVKTLPSHTLRMQAVKMCGLMNNNTTFILYSTAHHEAVHLNLTARMSGQS